MKISNHRVFFLSEEDFVTTQKAIINPSDSFHLAQVLRLNNGDKIVVMTMSGKYEAVIEDANPSAVKVMVRECLEKARTSLLKIALVQALPKVKKMDEIIEKATEFGVSDIFPVISCRSQVGLASPSLSGKEERWERIAMAASKQSRRFDLPIIHPISTLPCWLEKFEGYGQAVKILLWEQEQDTHLIHIVPKVKETQAALLCIGPEGGFTLHEANEFLQRDFISCSLGHRILRTETAGPFAAGFLMSASEG